MGDPVEWESDREFKNLRLQWRFFCLVCANPFQLAMNSVHSFRSLVAFCSNGHQKTTMMDRSLRFFLNLVLFCISVSAVVAQVGAVGFVQEISQP